MTKKNEKTKKNDARKTCATTWTRYEVFDSDTARFELVGSVNVVCCFPVLILFIVLQYFGCSHVIDSVGRYCQFPAMALKT